MPVSLLDSATWAVPGFAPFIRMAVAHAVRRGLAEAVLRRWRRVADPADVLAGQGAPPDPGLPLLPPLPIAAIPGPAAREHFLVTPRLGTNLKIGTRGARGRWVERTRSYPHLGGGSVGKGLKPFSIPFTACGADRDLPLGADRTFFS